MYIYVAMVGSETQVMLNGLWAALDEGVFEPEKVLMFCDGDIPDSVEEDLHKLLKAYGLSSEVGRLRDHEDMIELTAKGHDLAVDITGGTTEEVARLLIHLSPGDLRHLYILHCDPDIDVTIPYPLINRRKTKFVDLMEEVREVG